MIMPPSFSDTSPLPQGLQRASGGSLILQRKLISSGEGSIYLTDDPLSLAKVYHVPTIEKAQKLYHMLEQPPQDPTLSQGHISIAWPKDLILDKQKSVCGFLMPKIRGGVTLPLVYNPRLRRKKYPGFNWYYLHTTALNIAWIIESIHAKGYIIGDLKPENFLVNDKALVSIIDTDSFQIPRNAEETPFLCPVGSEGFTPPELFNKDLTKETRFPFHDHFGLAVLIYQLLFGIHPFSGIWKGTEDPPSLKDRIQKGLIPFAPWGVSKLMGQSPLTPPLTILPKLLQQTFLEAFTDGHLEPKKRPSAQKWHQVLEKSLEELQVCNNSSNHFLYSSQDTCPWCSLAQVSSVDIFPPLLQGEQISAFTSIKLFEKALQEGKIEKAESFLTPFKGAEEERTSIFQKAFLTLSQVKNDYTHLISFASFLEKHPTEAEIISYFTAHSFLEKSVVYTIKTSLLHNKSLQEIHHQALTYMKAFDHLKNLRQKADLSKSPLSFLFEDLLSILPEEEIHQHPIFSNLSKDIQEAKQLFEQYRLLKQHILEGTEEGIFLWHPCFEGPLKRDGMWIPFLNLAQSHLKSFSSSSAYILEKTKIFEGTNGIWVRLFPNKTNQTQISPVQHLFQEGFIIYIHQEEEIESSISSFSFPIFPHMLKRKTDFFIDTSFLSSKKKSSFFVSIASLWLLGKTPLTHGPLTSLEKEKSLQPVYVKISTSSFFKKFLHFVLKNIFPSHFSNEEKIKVSLRSPKPLNLPPLVLKIGRHRTSLDLDPPSQSQIIAKIPSFSLQQKITLTLFIPKDTFLQNTFRKGVFTLEKEFFPHLSDTSSFFFVS